MPESGAYESVRGTLGNRHPYRERQPLSAGLGRTTRLASSRTGEAVMTQTFHGIEHETPKTAFYADGRIPAQFGFKQEATARQLVTLTGVSIHWIQARIHRVLISS